MNQPQADNPPSEVKNSHKNSHVFIVNRKLQNSVDWINIRLKYLQPMDESSITPSARTPSPQPPSVQPPLSSSSVFNTAHVPNNRIAHNRAQPQRAPVALQPVRSAPVPVATVTRSVSSTPTNKFITKIINWNVEDIHRIPMIGPPRYLAYPVDWETCVFSHHHPFSWERFPWTNI